MSEFEIEEGIPPPDPEQLRHAKYPFANMKIGDSFALDRSKVGAVKSAAQAYMTRHDGVRFVFKQIGTDVWRCWKLEKTT